MHDQKFEIFYSLRPEDGLYGSNEPKKCEIRPVVSSIVHFKVFKSYFIYIIDRSVNAYYSEMMKTFVPQLDRMIHRGNQESSTKICYEKFRNLGPISEISSQSALIFKILFFA